MLWRGCVAFLYLEFHSYGLLQSLFLVSIKSIYQLIIIFFTILGPMPWFLFT